MSIFCEVHAGTCRDAILFSVGANAAHAMKRTPADKRKAVKTLLEDSEWQKWNDHEIARQCKVSHTFVASLRPVTRNVASEKSTPPRTYTTKHGTVSTMKTGNIISLLLDATRGN